MKALPLHKKLNGKLTINSKISLKTRNFLSLAYTPGVADVVRRIKQNTNSIYDLTIKKKYFGGRNRWFCGPGIRKCRA